MGVKAINPLLRRYAPDAFITIPISHLLGKRIAIDGHNWMYTNMAIARKKVINRTDVAIQEPNPIEIRREWFSAAIHFITGWLINGITPVFVFDGPDTPGKDETKAKRRDNRIAIRIKIDALYTQLRNNTLERPANIVEELRKELRNFNYISSEDFELFKMVIKGIGIPCLQATGDGERLCSMLCIEGKVAAVFSIDTDNLVYGCPLIITGFSETYTYDDHGNRIAHMDCVRHDRILTGLNIPHSVFVDLCIMSGCDYNTNMPGYAAIKSYALLQKHGTIDDLPRNLNTDCLKHLRCRELFKYVPSDSLIDRTEPVTDVDGGSPKIDYEGLKILPKENVGPLDINKGALATARDYLEMAGISGQIERLILCYHQVIPATDGLIEQLSLAPGPHYTPPVPRVFLNIMRSPATPIVNGVPIMPNVPQPTEVAAPKFMTLNIMSTATNPNT